MSDSTETKTPDTTMFEKGKPERVEQAAAKPAAEKPKPAVKAEKAVAAPPPVVGLKKMTITLDNTPEEVLSYDRDGYLLSFDDSPAKFLDLPTAVYKELSMRNRDSYSVSYTFYRKSLEERDNPPSGIRVEGRGASATQRLKVTDPREGVHKAWIRPDMVDEFQAKGYKVSNDPRVKTFGSDPGSTHTVAAYGATELILAEIPEKDFQANQEALADKAVGKSRAIDQATQAALEAAGGKMDPRFKAGAFTPKKKEVIRTRVR